jgi:hypothetical protein
MRRACPVAVVTADETLDVSSGGSSQLHHYILFLLGTAIEVELWRLLLQKSFIFLTSQISGRTPLCEFQPTAFSAVRTCGFIYQFTYTERRMLVRISTRESSVLTGFS